MLAAEPVVAAFRRGDAEVIRIGVTALRLQLCTIPLWGYIVMSNMFTQSIGFGVRATLIASARQGIFLAPMLLTLPRLLGLVGLQLAQPAADAATFAVTVWIVSGILRQLRAMPDRKVDEPHEA